MRKLVIDASDIRKFDKTRYRDGAQDNDYDYLITEPTCVYIRHRNGDEELKIVYDELPDDPTLAAIENVLDGVKYSKVTRLSGPKAETQIFGTRPAHSMKNNMQSCSSTKMAYEQPDLHAIVASGSEVIAQIYERYNPKLYYDHINQTQSHVKQEYHMEQTAFTSGIINKNNPLGYHYDKGNFSGVWSGMIVYKRFIEGGHLSCPEYNIGFQLKNRSLLLFDGQGIIHGVTPITKLHPTLARRYSIVYYSLHKMWNCLPIQDEIKRANENRTTKERARTEAGYNEQFRAKQIVPKLTE
jgi:hypothetical protein